MVARQTCKQITALRYRLHMMGVSLDGLTWLFGDNASVINSSSIPHSTLNKHHNTLSHHCVNEYIAAMVLKFIHLDGT
jgi:hypothetical protein